MSDVAKSTPAVEASVAGIRKWDEAMAEALGVRREDVNRTTGCEVESRITTDNPGVFKRSLKALKRGTFRGYAKEPTAFPKEFNPEKWQSKVDQKKPPVNDGVYEIIAKDHAEYTLEPTTFVPGIGIERREANPLASQAEQHGSHAESYLTTEIVSTPIESPARAARWLSHAGQHMVDVVEAQASRLKGRKGKGQFFVDYRAQPTSGSWANSVHMHLGMQVALPALLNSAVFPDGQKASMLERNVGFYRDSLQGEGTQAAGDIAICSAIEKACQDGSTPEQIMQNDQYAQIIGRISVNMFSKRELEGDVTTIDAEDVKVEASRRAAKINIPRDIIVGDKVQTRLFSEADIGQARYVGKDEISRFAVIFGRELEKFNHGCALVNAPAKSSYERFKGDGIVTPRFNAAGHRKMMNTSGAYLFRGEERPVYGPYNATGKPDTGPLRIETRIMCSEAIGHPNHAYPNQRSMPYELVEGMEYVFAKTAQQYAAHLQGRATDTVTESELFSTFDRCVQEFPRAYPPDIIPKEQQLTTYKEAAVERFLAPGSVAEEVYGRERLEGMVTSRDELDRLIHHDFNGHCESPGPQNLHTDKIGVTIDPTYERSAARSR